MKPLQLKGATVLITGASSGIGKSLSRCFAQEGSILLLGCHPGERQILESWASELSLQFGSMVSTYPVDLSRDDGPESLYVMAKRDHPKIDILVNNAGIISYGEFYRIPVNRHETLVRVNALAYLKLMHLALDDMVARGSGRVLNVVSVSAFQPTAFQAVYGATKAFIQSLSGAINQELAGTGIMVCTLNPSYTDTPMLKGNDFPRHLRWFKISGLSDPDTIARKGIKAFKKGKLIYIPGLSNWFVHSVLIKFTPRIFADFLSRFSMREGHH